jgi:hypothetical protein
MQEIKKAAEKFMLENSFEFAQRGLTVQPYDKKNISALWHDFEMMDCPAYRAAYPIQTSPIKEPLIADYYQDVTGEFLDVGLHISGSPECWFRSDLQPKKQINILVQYNIYQAYTAAEASKWLSGIVGLYYSLIKRYSVSLSCSWATTGKGGRKIELSKEIVGHSEYLNEAKVQYIFSPIFYRLFIFSYYHSEKALQGFKAHESTIESYKKGPRKEGDQYIIPPLYNKFFNDKEPDFQNILNDIQKVYM